MAAAVMVGRPRGTEDVLPAQSGRWQRAERIAREFAGRWGFGEIRTPTFEHTELIHRVGESTDVVQKETYDFADRGGRQLSLRPEGTAAVVRACLQGGLVAQGLPVKVYYLSMSAFRYERPEAGRLREHHQFGCETLGAPGPAADAELVSLLGDYLAAVGIHAAVAHVNSIGCQECRPRYREALRAYYGAHLAELCADCRRRLDQNPLRLLDCRVDRALALQAPRAVDFLCADCAAHHASLGRLLDAAGLAWEQDHLLVRGFDYYTRTVFEFVHGGLGAQSGLGGGGRYDRLVAELGGPDIPAAGFGLGLERLLLALEKEGQTGGDAPACSVLVAGDDVEQAFAMATALRRSGLQADFDPLGRSLKAQLRHASRLGARFVAILGAPDEAVVLRDMALRQQRPVQRDGLAAAVAEAAPLDGA